MLFFGKIGRWGGGGGGGGEDHNATNDMPNSVAYLCVSSNKILRHV